MQKKIGAKNNWEEYISDDVLDMSLLQLTEFPAKNKIILPKMVTNLNLSNNLLVAIPPHLCTLIQIKEIDLSKNKLKNLPEQFGDLVNLRKLDLYDNQLSFLPLSFHKLQKLKWLDISSNPISPALLSIAGPCTDSKECEKAAHNIVKYFGLLTTQASEEFEKAKQADIDKAETEVFVEAKAAEVKSKKRKNKNAAKQERERKWRELKDPAEAEAESESMEQSQPRGGRLWTYVLFYVFSFIAIGYLYTWTNDLSVEALLQCLKTGNNCSQMFLH